MPAASEPEFRRVAALLADEYGTPERDRRGPVLDGLIQTILAQNTTGTNARRAWADLRAAYPSWDAALDAAPEDLAAAIRVAGLGELRAARIQAILRRVLEQEGELSLERLADAGEAQVVDELVAFDGVGVKTAACVLLFTLGREVFPVDTHVHRLANRLGWVATRSPDQTHAALAARIPADLAFPLHVNLIRHGRAVCRARRPACERCVLREGCPNCQVNR